jgi:5-methyltetrahydropteroyltriglutamate--homocysteine methyltransferase
MQTYAYGFPRLIKNRKFKKITEEYWNNKITESQLQEGLDDIENEILSIYDQNVDRYPVGEMTKYDKMVDTACMLGLYNTKTLDDYYELTRGKGALELTKWFNTNYHYLVPDFSLINDTFTFKRPKFNLTEKLNNFKDAIPYMIGPFTFLKLSKGIKEGEFQDLFYSLTDVYAELISDFDQVHLDEPAFCFELKDDEVNMIKTAYSKFKQIDCKINVFTYYESVDFLKDLYDLPINGIGLDFVSGKDNIDYIKEAGFPDDKVLYAGVVSGRNIWRQDIRKAVEFLKHLQSYAKEIVISNAAPLYHLPVTKEDENLDPRLMEKISFAKERLEELKLISEAFEGENIQAEFEEEDFGINNEVRNKVSNLKEEDFVKSQNYSQRQEKQKQILNLPILPTTTIGSYPQTKDLREKRSAFKKNRISANEYKEFIQNKIKDLIKFQESLGLDVLVHGEFERSDMVEFFADKLEGIATTKKGWIISYGTRGYRPPIIYGDISRSSAMTVDEISYAQSLTERAVKGMLTGPVTILAWSYVREDMPISEVSYQIALCLQEEIKDYEKNGIKIVQIDEPAFREKAPIKKRYWSDYFSWATNSFNLASRAKPETQIHTHMCYSEFGPIIEYIKMMDFDCITIEASRSRGDIIEDFKKIDFKRQIGLGVWDIHSPAVPSVENMTEIVERALEALPKENFWINPDCGLKTRDWPEVKASLNNLVKTAKKLRQDIL